MQHHAIPSIHCLGVVCAKELADQLAHFDTLTDIHFQSCAKADLLFSELGSRDVDCIIIDQEFLETTPAGVTNLSEFIGVARKIKPGLPVLVIFSAGITEDTKELAVAAGVSDFLSLPLSRCEFALRVRYLSQTVRLHQQYRDSSMMLEDEIRKTIGEVMVREYETLSILGKAAEYKDRETGFHITRVSHYSKLIAKVIGESALNQEALFHASALHDIGKLGIPDAILLKPGKLTNEEFDIMKNHCVIGHSILKNSQSSYLLTGAMIALTHHEKYDGTGYPMGIQGEEIPLFGRIVGIADVFDALTTARPYKDAWPLDKAFDLVSRERGRQFDPTLVDAFISNALGIEWIYHNMADTKALVGDI